MGRPRLSPKKREKIETYARETPLSVRAVAKEVGVNGQTFKLVAEPAEVRQSANAYLIPEHGAITISIGAFVHPGEGNYMDVLSQVPPGSDADIIIADLLLAGQEIA